MAPPDAPVPTTEAPASIDIRAIEPVLAAQAAAGGCTWPWLVKFLQSLTRASRVAVRLARRQGGDLTAHGAEPAPGLLAMMERQDDELAGMVRRDRQAVARKCVVEGDTLYQLGTPLSGPDEPVGAMILWAKIGPNQPIEPVLVLLQLVAGYGHARAATGGSDVPAGLAARLAQAKDRLEAAQAFADEAVRLAGCDSAAVATGAHGRRRVTAVSGAGRLDRAGPLTAAIEEMLREIEDGASPTGWHAAGADLARLWDCRAVRAWFPGDAAVLLGFRAESPPRDLDRRLEAAAPAWASMTSVASRMRVGGAGRRFGWKVALVVAALAAAAMFIPVRHTIRVAARVEAAELRTVSAPADGTLAANLVEPGQVVEAGQVLGRMDDAEVRLRLAEVRSVRDRALAQHASILSQEGGDTARAQLALLDAEAAAIEIRLLEHRLASLTLTAPVAGTVLRESSTLVGGRVGLGQPLYEIAPAGAIRLELDVPDNRVAYVHEGQELTVRVDSFPGRSWRAVITRLNPRSEVREGGNWFGAEAEPDEAAAEWRIGMRGRAGIDGGKRALGWVLFHPVAEFFEWLVF